MGSLIAECPMTRAPLDTGIDTDYMSLAKSWDKDIVIRCGHCGEVHRMKVRETYIRASGFMFGII